MSGSEFEKGREVRVRDWKTGRAPLAAFPAHDRAVRPLRPPRNRTAAGMALGAPSAGAKVLLQKSADVEEGGFCVVTYNVGVPHGAPEHWGAKCGKLDTLRADLADFPRDAGSNFDVLLLQDHPSPCGAALPQWPQCIKRPRHTHMYI